MTGFIDLTLISLAISFVIMVMYRFLTDPKEIKKIKAEIKHYKSLMNKAQKSGDTAGMQKYMGEMMKLNQQHLRHNMKPMLVSMVFVIVVLGYLKSSYSGFSISLPFALPFFGNEMSWFWWYVIISFASTLVFRKMLGVE